MGITLKSIFIDNYEIRKRDGGDLKTWVRSIDSVVTFRTLKGEVERNGKKENCMVSAKVCDRDLQKVTMHLIFSDTSMLSRTAPIEFFFPAEYTAALKEEKRKGKTIKGDNTGKGTPSQKSHS